MKSLSSILVMAVLGTGCAPSAERTVVPVQNGAGARVVRPLPTTYLMRGLVSIHFENLRSRLISDVAVSEEEQRESIAMSAALLLEASSLLMRSPPHDDEAWILATSRLLRGGSEKILQAVEVSDVAAARKAFDQMRRACSACHRDCPADLLGQERPGY